MTTFVLATNSVHTSALLCDYLDDRLQEGDVVHAVNSLRGGDATSSADVRDGEDALNAVGARLGATADVETHQFVRENSPAEDIVGYAEQIDADEIVLGVRKRNPTSKVVFGSVAQDILLNANRPMVVVPREEV
ncbi:Universal stress protein family protein [Halogranum amylolyticum]|uniref:Universal stress protein family protein n=1 Tax=Halogranum amylolyticum TaxID=660520 RepID=A0A1H8NE42_9EURY|nr:universal stress protein [Halogranum amylolyticum]SEO27738.1 Universal stress protein family protein [Halogranum amylolyticum]